MSDSTSLKVLTFTILLLTSSYSLAQSSIGLDYFNSDVTISGVRDTLAEANTDGLGFSLGLSPKDAWLMHLSYSSYSGAATRSNFRDITSTLSAEDDSRVYAFTLTYLFDSAWLSLGISRTNATQTAIEEGLNTRSLDIEQTQQTTSLTVETGYEWALDDWSPAISMFLTNVSTDFERDIRLDTENVFSESQTNESLTGIDIGLSGGLTYYYALTDSILLAPSAGLFYQTNLDGDVEGRSAYRFQNRDNRQASGNQTYRGGLGSLEEINSNLNISLLTNNWIWSAGYIAVLSSGESGDSWFASVNYLF